MLMRIVSKVRTSVLVLNSVRLIGNAPRIIEASNSGILYRQFLPTDAEAVRPFIRQLNNGFGFDGRRLLYRLVGNKLIVIAELPDQRQSKIVGVDLFYFNQRDLKEGTVHEGFIGVDPKYQGRGIAGEMRKHAISHFSRAGLKGISTRISLSNKASLASALKLGFQPVDTYKDQVTGEDRHYLVKWFS